MLIFVLNSRMTEIKEWSSKHYDGTEHQTERINWTFFHLLIQTGKQWQFVRLKSNVCEFVCVICPFVRNFAWKFIYGVRWLPALCNCCTEQELSWIKIDGRGHCDEILANQRTSDSHRSQPQSHKRDGRMLSKDASRIANAVCISPKWTNTFSSAATFPSQNAGLGVWCDATIHKLRHFH